VGRRQRPAERSGAGLGAWSGGLGFDDRGHTVADDDRLAGDGLELGSEVTRSALSVDAGFVVPGTEVVELGGGVGQQVVDDDEDRVADCDDGLLFTAAAGQAPVAGAQDTVGTRGGGAAPLAHDRLRRLAYPSPTAINSPGWVARPCPYRRQLGTADWLAGALLSVAPLEQVLGASLKVLRGQ
jgi:hypothetical protein